MIALAVWNSQSASTAGTGSNVNSQISGLKHTEFPANWQKFHTEFTIL
jgi:hypothetical protein